MEPSLVKNTLKAFITNQATPMQKKLVAEWLRDAAVRDLFFQLVDEWERANLQFIPDQHHSWAQLINRIEEDVTRSAPHIQPFTIQRNLFATKFKWLIAASISLTIGFLTRQQWLYKSYQTTFGEVTTHTLPDGSRITLNANSALKTRRFDWGSGPREVWLAGEAEFMVQHTVDDRQFIVKTPDGTQVNVLGTEFVVFSRERGTRVVLHKGKVQLQSSQRFGAKPLTLKPGDVVSVDRRGTFRYQRNQVTAEHSAWKQHQFVFNRTALKDIALQVQETFGVEVILADDTLAKREITGTYEAETASELLHALTRLLDAHLTMEGKKARITPRV